MYCVNCGQKIEEGKKFCGACGKSIDAQTQVIVADKRPIAGIAVATIIGIIGIPCNIVVIFKSLYYNPMGVEAILYQAFPALQSITFLSSSIGIAGVSILLIGVLLVFLRHPNGNKTVRITCYCMLLAIIGMFIASYFAIVESTAWSTLDSSTQGGLIGGLVGGLIGGIFEWSLILFLFRKRRWG